MSFLFDKCFAILLLVALILPTTVLAKYVAVLETVADPAAGEMISLQERQFLTDVLRGQAVMQLPAEQNFTIMTRENINVMLPPGKSIEDCEGSCLAETGKNIAADYVAQARIALVGGTLAISAEVYETAGNKLLASFSGRGGNFDELEKMINEKAPDFFRKVKNSSGAWGAGFGDMTSGGEFAFQGKKKFIVEIETNPEGALPTVDGRGIPKCTSTPCVVPIEEGEHRFVVSKDHYDDAEIVVSIVENNQKVSLTLTPNYGYLSVNPVVEIEPAKLRVLVDDKSVGAGNFGLDPGTHSVLISHPCYDPVEFKVGIERNKTATFDKTMARGVGGLVLDAEKDGVPQVVPVFVNGESVGNTPFEGQVPLCSEITVESNGIREVVPVDLRWHEIFHATYKIKEPALAEEQNDVKNKADAAYSELDGKSAKNAQTGESIPANVDSNKGGIHWVPVVISAAVTIAGATVAAVGYNKANSAHDKKPKDADEYKKNKDEIHSGSVLNTIGLITTVVGVVGLGLSFSF